MKIDGSIFKFTIVRWKNERDGFKKIFVAKNTQVIIFRH